MKKTMVFVPYNTVQVIKNESRLKAMSLDRVYGFTLSTG